MSRPVAATDATSLQSLENQVNQLAGQLGIRPAKWREFMELLGELKRHNPSMYAHSLRVGLYTSGLAALAGESDRHFPLFGGCGHDIGKCEVSNHLLDAKNLSDEGYQRIKSHSAKGYDKLKDRFLFTAYIAGLHHRYRQDGYGIDLDADSPIDLPGPLREKIKRVATMVMIADFYDALTTRQNNKGLVKNFGDTAEGRAVMHKHFPDHPDWVDWLFEHRLSEHVPA